MPSPGITKTILADAIKQLMAKEPLSKISVGEIVDYCHLNRNSFYYHFKDKYDLVNWIFYTELTEEMTNSPALDSWGVLEQICCFFYRDQVFYANALSVTGQNSFSEYFMELMKSVLRETAEELFEADEDRDFYALFLADAFIVTLSRWLMEGAKTPPEKLALMMKKVLTGAAMQLVQMEADKG